MGPRQRTSPGEGLVRTTNGVRPCEPLEVCVCVVRGGGSPLLALLSRHPGVLDSLPGRTVGTCRNLFRAGAGEPKDGSERKVMSEA